MKDKQIEKEITTLQSIQYKWNNKYAEKQFAKKLINEINIFNNSFEDKYPHAKQFYKEDSFAKSKIDEGTCELKFYLKKTTKEDEFNSGIEKIQSGIDIIIIALRNILTQKEV